MKTSVRSAVVAILVAGSTALFFHLQTASAQPQPSAKAEMKASASPLSQDAKPMLSPPAQAEVTLNGKSITIHYNSPRLRGREIGGPEIVPWGKVWRTGANPATSFVTDIDLMVGDLHVPAGKYTLYTLPAAPGTPWQLIINKQTGQWGTEYNQGQDLGRTPMQHSTLPSPQEDMSISFEHTTKNSTELHIRWEKTDEWVKIEAH